MRTYTDNDPFCCNWLTALVKEDLLPAGRVVCSDIQDLTPRQCTAEMHFFAGIGGWPLALQMADWREGPVWTASCPCQPFAQQGKRRGTEDEQHLWPHLYRLICECRPPTIFGEQIASGLGYQWLDAVLADLEAADYAVGAADIPAAGMEAHHRRQRLWWVAYSNESGCPWQSGNKGMGRQIKERISRARPSLGREAEPSFLQMVDGLPARMGRLRAYGNALVPQVAEQFIRAARGGEEQASAND